MSKEESCGSGQIRYFIRNSGNKMQQTRPEKQGKHQQNRVRKKVLKNHSLTSIFMYANIMYEKLAESASS